MVRNFKMRKIAIWNWLFALVIMIAIVWTVWETNDYWNLFPLILPILIVIDERMTRIQVRDNGDIWIRRGLSGSVKAYGVMRIIKQKTKKPWSRGRVLIYYTKGFINVDFPLPLPHIACVSASQSQKSSQWPATKSAAARETKRSQIAKRR